MSKVVSAVIATGGAAATSVGGVYLLRQENSVDKQPTTNIQLLIYNYYLIVLMNLKVSPRILIV